MTAKQQGDWRRNEAPFDDGPPFGWLAARDPLRSTMPAE